MRSFFNVVIASFGIVGSVVGAGFISGKEVCVFFCDDLSVSGVYSSFLVFLFGVIVFTSVDEKLFKVIAFFVSLFNVLVLSCMLAAVDELAVNLLRLSEKVKIFAILSLILVFIISLNGVRVIGMVASVLVPVELIVTLIVCVKFGDGDMPEVSPLTAKGCFYPILYAAFNAVLISTAARCFLKNLNATEKTLSVLISAALIYLALTIIAVNVKNLRDFEMPTLEFSVDGVQSVLLRVCICFAVFTALVSSSYSACVVAGENSVLKFVILLLALALSESGFGFIADKLYPVVGAFGIIAVIYSVFYTSLFQVRRRPRTLNRQARRV